MIPVLPQLSVRYIGRLSCVIAPRGCGIKVAMPNAKKASTNMTTDATLGCIRVVSIRKGHPDVVVPGEVVVRCDRKHPVLGNPFVLDDHKDASRRREVIEQFVEAAKADMAIGGPISHEIDALVARVRAGERIALACWCKPLDCHLDWVAQQVYAKAYAGVGAKALYAALEPQRLAYEALAVLKMRKADRWPYVDRVRLRRGAAAATALRDTVLAQHQASAALSPETAPGLFDGI